MISKFSFGKKNGKILLKYLLFFEEQFFYFVWNKVFETNNPTLRRIGNRYNLNDVNNITIEDRENENRSQVKIHLGGLKNKVKEFYIDKNQSKIFSNLISKIWKK